MKNKTKNSKRLDCPCGSEKELKDCCGIYHAGVPAPDPQILMRSRYSAYVLCLDKYLLDTWYVSTRPERLDLDPAIKWIALSVKSFSVQGDEGWVDFVAKYKINGRAGFMREKSHFLHEHGSWFYVDGVEPAAD